MDETMHTALLCVMEVAIKLIAVPIVLEIMCLT
jgi:hypothetical protein